MNQREVRGADPAAWTAGTVARRLGISQSTLRTWNRRYGLGPADHEPGRYRLYSEADIAELQTVQQLIAEGMPVAAAATAARNYRHAGAGRRTRRTHNRPPRSLRGLESAALRLDAHAVLQALDLSIAARGVLPTWFRLCEPLLVRLGQRIADTGDCMDVELMVGWAITASLHRAPRGEPWSKAPRVLLACADGERHSLVLEALHAALAEDGVATRMLGAAVPSATLLDAAARACPAVVVVSSHVPRTARVSVLRRLVPHTDRVVAAGPGWEHARVPAGVERMATLETALQLVRHCVGAPTSAGS